MQLIKQLINKDHGTCSSIPVTEATTLSFFDVAGLFIGLSFRSSLSTAKHKQTIGIIMNMSWRGLGLKSSIRYIILNSCSIHCAFY